MRRIGPYALKGLAGTGGTGVVYSALHEIQGNQVALKLLSKGTLGDTQAVAAFEREVRATAALDHPRVVRIYDFGRLEQELELEETGLLSAGTPWLATEWVAGGPLHHAPAPRSWPELRGLLAEILDALGHAHAHDLVHRDLKPANLLLSQAGSLSGVKLADLGIARHRRDRTDDVLAGTPAYMAPEQILRTHEGPWTDLYALGVLGWQQSTGRRPFSSPDLQQILAAHLTRELPAFEPMISVPGGFADWLAVLLAKRPRDRFACAADARAVLMGLEDPDTESAERAPRITPSDAGPTFVFDGAPAETDLQSSRPFAEPAPPLWVELEPDWGAPEPVVDPEMVDVAPVLFGLRQPPVVGRRSQQEQLWGLLRAVERQRRPQVALLHGPSGCGRTTLAEWVRVRAREQGWFGWTVDLRQQPDGVAGIVATRLDVVDLRPDALAQALRARELGDDEGLWIAALLAPSELEGAETLESERQRVQVAARVLEAAAEARPTVLVFDGVHRDAGSIRLAGLLAEAEVPLLILMTAAEDEDTEPAAERALSDFPVELERIEVGPLDETTMRLLLRSGLGIGGRVAMQLALRAGGNPQFLVQLVGLCLSQGLVAVTAHGPMIEAGSLPELPADQAAAAQERVQRLFASRPGADPTAVEIAALLGHLVEAGEWRDACERAGVVADSRWMTAMVRERLALLAPNGWSLSPSVRAALLARTAASARAQALHLACAQALLGRQRTGERVGMHLFAAGRWEEAIDPLLEAAARLRSQSSDSAAAALTAAEESVERAALSPADLRRTRALRIHGELVLTNGGREEAEDCWARALAGPDVASQAVERAWCWVGLAQCARMRGDATQALERFESAASGLDVDEPVHRSVWFFLRRNLVSLLVDLRRLDEAEAMSRADLAAGVGAAMDEGWHRYNLGRVLIDQGAYDEAEALLRMVHTAFRQANALRGMADAVNLLGDVARKRGRLREAEAHYIEALRGFRMVGQLEVGITHANLGMIRIADGRYDLAERDLLRAEAILRRAKWIPMVAAMQVGQAVCGAGVGDWASFDRLIAEARPVIDRARFAAGDLLDLLECAVGLADRAARPDRAAMLRGWLQSLGRQERPRSDE